MSVSEGKTRRLGVWLDLDPAIKREMETHAGCQNFANEAGWDLILDPDLVESIRSSKGKVSYDGVLGPDPQAAPGQRMGEDVVATGLR